jgi:integrase/recombinase XerC
MSDNSFALYSTWLRQERRCSEHTVSSYELDLAKLQTLAAGRDLTDLATHDIRLMTAKLNAQGLGARSIARALSAWRGYYAWLVKSHGLAANPVAGIRAPKAPKLLPKALAVDDAQALAAFNPGASPEDTRDHAIAELLYSSGLRLAELLSLDVRQIKTPAYASQSWLELAEAQVNVLGKGSKRRIAPVGSHAIVALTQWLSVRDNWQLAAVKHGAEHALFLTSRGTRLAARSLQQRLHDLALRAGTSSRVHPHVLRHSAASHLLQSSGDLRAVQEFLGHSSIASTQIYTKLDWQHLAKAYDSAHPRAKRKSAASAPLNAPIK